MVGIPVTLISTRSIASRLYSYFPTEQPLSNSAATTDNNGSVFMVFTSLVLYAEKSLVKTHGILSGQSIADYFIQSGR